MTHKEKSERRKQIAMYAKDHPELLQRDLAEKFGFSQTCIAQMIMEWGVGIGRNGRASQRVKERKNRVVEFLKKNRGMSDAEVGKALGYTESQITLTRRKAGIKGAQRYGHPQAPHVLKALRVGYDAYCQRMGFKRK